MSEQREKLRSLHPVEIDLGEIGVTIRNGVKWYNKIDRGDYVDLIYDDTVVGHYDQPQGLGLIVNKRIELFKNIKARDIDREHEISSRNYSGLLASMRRAYGDDFGEDSVITILTYRRVE